MVEQKKQRALDNLNFKILIKNFQLFVPQKNQILVERISECLSEQLLELLILLELLPQLSYPQKKC